MDETLLSPNNKKLPLYGARPMSTDGDLCTACAAVFQHMLWPEPDPEYEPVPRYPQGFIHPCVGWLDRLLTTKGCALCQFLTRVFFRTSEAFPESEITNHRRFLCQLAPFGPISEITGVALGWNMRIYFSDIRTDDTATKPLLEWTPISSSPELRLLTDSAELLVDHPDGYREGDKITDLAFLVDDQCSAAFLKRTYRLCLHQHGIACKMPKIVLSNAPRPSSEAPHRAYPSRLIDVNEGRVIRAPANCEYLALSYCWAKETYTVLLQSNQAALQRENGLDDVRLAPTIVDAIKVVRIIGQRYLWVDSLCIRQDDKQSKMDEIAAMSTIYRSATLTIIAAGHATDGIDVGLLGMRPGNRPRQQEIVEINGFKFAAAMPDLWTIIRSSRWYTRAWTYQEHHLSKRELIFTPYQAFFVCEKDAFSEDYCERACVHLEDVDDARACCAYQTPENFDNRVVVGENGIDTYEICARSVSTRDLSYESDALNAITGVLSIMEAETGVGFLCGLPVRHLVDYFILWLPKKYLRRRGLNTFGLPFPSWSWIGWVGPVDYPVTGDGFDGRMRYAHDSLVLECAVMVPTAEAADCTVEGVGYRKTALDKVRSQRIESALLQFTASCVLASVSRFVWGTFKDCEERVSRCHGVFVQGFCAGLIILDSEMEKAQEVDLTDRTQQEAWSMSASHTETCELIALATTDEPWGIYLPHERDPDADANYWALDEDGDPSGVHMPFDINKWPKADCQLVNVMLLESTGEIAFRRGIGQMHYEAWQTLQPSEKPILLG